MSEANEFPISKTILGVTSGLLDSKALTNKNLVSTSREIDSRLSPNPPKPKPN